MPGNFYLRLEHPKKLQDKCIQIIAGYFEEVLQRCTEMDIVYLQRRSQLLLDTFKGQYGIHVSLQFALFCLPHIKELDLKLLKKCDRLLIARTLGTVENVITVLNAFAVSSDVLHELLPFLPETLQCLNLQLSSVTDRGMAIIASRCPNLEQLNLTHCEKIGDHGLKALCAKDEQGNILPNLVLRILKLEFACAITSEGVKFVIDNCPNLSELRHDDVFKVMYQKYSRVVSSGSLENQPRYNLKSISVCAGRRCDYLKSFVILCPFIQTLEVMIDSQKTLDTVAEFPSLTDIKFVMYEPCDLLSFLEKRGQNLKILDISFLCDSSISSEILVQFCPRLEHLSLCQPRFAKVKDVTSHTRQDILFSLTELNVECARPDYLEESLLYILSRSPFLQILTFRNENSPFVSSSFVNSLISCKAMSTLKEVQMLNVDIDIAELQGAFQNLRMS